MVILTIHLEKCFSISAAKNKNCSVTGIVDNNRPLSFGYLYGWGTNVLFTNTSFMINELQLTATEVQLFYSTHKK